MHDMGNYNRLALSRLACNIIDYRYSYIPYLYNIYNYGNINRYEARSVAVMVLQYLIVRLKINQKIQAQVGLW